MSTRPLSSQGTWSGNVSATSFKRLPSFPLSPSKKVSVSIKASGTVKLGIAYGRNSDPDGTDAASGLPWGTTAYTVTSASNVTEGGAHFEIELSGAPDKAQVIIQNEAGSAAAVRVDWEVV